MFILNYPAFIRTAAAVSNRIDQLNEWFSKQQGSIGSQLNNIHKNTRDNLSRNRRRIEQLQREQNEVGDRTTRDENINKLEKMDKSLKLDYKAQLTKQYEKLLNRVETNAMMVERVSPKDEMEASRKQEMLSFFNEMEAKLNEGIRRIQHNVDLESAFPIVTKEHGHDASNVKETPSVEEYYDMPTEEKDYNVEFNKVGPKEWVHQQSEEAKGLLDMAESDIESYVTTFNELKQEAQEKGHLVGYIERSVKGQDENGLSLVDENGVFSGGSSLIRGLKITPNLLESFGTVWFNTVQAIEPDDDNTWPYRFIFHAEIPYDSIDWKLMQENYVDTTEAIPGEIYVTKGKPVSITRIEQISDSDEENPPSYSMPAERKLTVKASLDLDNYKIVIGGDNMKKTALAILEPKYSNKAISKNTEFEKIAFDIFASLPIQNLKRVASVYYEINKNTSNDEHLKFLIASFFDAMDAIAPQGTKFSMKDGSLGFWGDTKISAVPYPVIEDEENLEYQEETGGQYHEPQFIADESGDSVKNFEAAPTDAITDTALSPEETSMVDDVEYQNEVSDFLSQLRKHHQDKKLRDSHGRTQNMNPKMPMGQDQEAENKNLVKDLSAPSRW